MEMASMLCRPIGIGGSVQERCTVDGCAMPLKQKFKKGKGGKRIPIKSKPFKTTVKCKSCHMRAGYAAWVCSPMSDRGCWDKRLQACPNMALLYKLVPTYKCLRTGTAHTPVRKCAHPKGRDTAAEKGRASGATRTTKKITFAS